MLTDEMIDAPRNFLMLYSGAHRQLTTSEMRKHLERCGDDTSCWPEWARMHDTPITKAGAAILIWEMMEHARVK